MPAVLITGSNRGIGLGLARLYAREGWSVLAACRGPGEALELGRLAEEHPGRVEILPLSVTEWDTVAKLPRVLDGRPLDLLVNNAGVRGLEAYGLGSLGVSAFMEAVRVNALGALKVTEALVPSLERAASPLVVMMSCSRGSLARNRDGGDYAYRASKAAMNAIMRSLAADLRANGITVIALHPGWVRTDMGGSGAPLSVEESVWAIRNVLGRVRPEDTGKFLRFDGREEPW